MYSCIDACMYYSFYWQPAGDAACMGDAWALPIIQLGNQGKAMMTHLSSAPPGPTPHA